MKKFKNILLTIAILSVTVWSCDDVLDQELRHSLSAAEAAQTAKGSQAILASALIELKRTFQSPALSVYRPCGTDLVRSGTNLVDEPATGMPGMNTYGAGMAANSEEIAELWDNLNNGIVFANQAIDGGTQSPIEELTDDQRDRLGQAYTMRAYLYLELVRRFGNIPIVPLADLTEGPNFETEQQTAAVVYDSIIADLQRAIPLMYTRSEGANDVLVPSQGMANLLLAEASLDIGDYQTAADAAEALIGDGSYVLQPLDNIFGLDGGKAGEESNQEIVFSIGFTPDVPDEVQWTSQQFMPLYDRTNGVARTIDTGGRPWSRLSPSDYYWSLFDANDGRLEAWHKLEWVFDDPDGLPAGATLGAVVTEADLEAQFGAGTIQMRYLDPTTWKYAENGTYQRTTAQAEGWRNIIMLRYSHAYLAAAEAYFGLTNAAQATTYLNVLRERAYGNPSGNFGTATFEDLVEEHGRELGHEGHRWAFLKRNGLLVERVDMHNPDATGNIQDRHNLWPIPLDFIDQTGATQNPGY